MNKLKNACRSSCEEWADNLELSCDSQFSQEFEEKMETLTGEIKVHKYRRPAKRTATLLINAAVILCFCATMFALPLTREKLLGIFRDDVYDSGVSDGNSANIWSDDKDYGSEPDSDNLYSGWDGAIDFEFGSGDIGSINDDSGQTGSASYEIPELELGYIPDGFSFSGNSTGITKAYINGDRHFEILKLLCKQVKRNQDNDAVIIGDIEYSVYEKDNNVRVIWNKGDYVYLLTGNLSRDELLKIASNAK